MVLHSPDLPGMTLNHMLTQSLRDDVSCISTSYLRSHRTPSVHLHSAELQNASQRDLTLARPRLRKATSTNLDKAVADSTGTLEA